MRVNNQIFQQSPLPTVTPRHRAPSDITVDVDNQSVDSLMSARRFGKHRGAFVRNYRRVFLSLSRLL